MVNVLLLKKKMWKRWIIIWILGNENGNVG